MTVYVDDMRAKFGRMHDAAPPGRRNPGEAGRGRRLAPDLGRNEATREGEITLKAYRLALNGPWVDLETIQSITEPAFTRNYFSIELTWTSAFRSGIEKHLIPVPVCDHRMDSPAFQEHLKEQLEKVRQTAFEPFVRAWKGEVETKPKPLLYQIELPPDLELTRTFAVSFSVQLAARAKRHQEEAHPFHDKFGDHPEAVTAAKASREEALAIRNELRTQLDSFVRDRMRERGLM